LHLQEAIAAGDTKLAAQYRRDLENKIKGCAKDISTKYINPPHTLEFAILFIPTESLYAEVLRQPGLFEQLQREYRVMIAGPTNLAALLTSFQMGFRSLARKSGRARSGSSWAPSRPSSTGTELWSTPCRGSSPRRATRLRTWAGGPGPCPEN
jgi:DNA recombination protein RmuC